jgi:membrane associated rhomboid family serine protease
VDQYRPWVVADICRGLFSARSAKTGALITGVLLVALSAYEMWEDRRSAQQGR